MGLEVKAVAAIRRMLRRVKLWLAIQALPVLDPRLHKKIAHASKCHIREFRKRED